MKTSYTVRRLWPWVPALGVTIGRHVFMRDPGSESTLAHELVHVRQQREHPVWFWVSYLLLLPAGWNPWRMHWEAEAYAVNVRDGTITVESAARIVAGPLYGWCCRPEAAEKAIRRFLRTALR